MSKGSAVTAGEAGVPRRPGNDSSESLQQYLRVLRGFFVNRVQASDVDDMIQDVAVRMHSRAVRDPIENPRRYIFQVARNVLIDQHRRNLSRHTAEHDTLEEWHHPVEEISPHRIVESADSLSQVMKALDLLPPRTRQAFVLHRFDHLSCSDIATQMGISISAVEKHIMRAIRRLGVALNDDRER